MFKKTREKIRRHGAAFILGLAFAIAAFLAINAISAPLSTSKFCGTVCHEMQPAYDTWLECPHYTNIYGWRSECIDCHLPPKDQFFRHLYEKTRTGVRDLWLHYLGPEYDREKVTQRVKDGWRNETCIRCHKDLLVKPSSKAVKYMHKGSLENPEDVWGKCLACHTVHAKKTESILAETE